MKLKLIQTCQISLMFVAFFSCGTAEKSNVTQSDISDPHLQLSDAQIQLANISIAEVKETTIGRDLSLTGVLKVNEQSVVTVSSRISGRIEKLYFRSTGETVKKGDKLFEFYSDELIDAQREYFNLQSNNWNFTGKYEPSLAIENKLLVMGLLPAQIKELGKTGRILFKVDIYSQAEGKIREINTSEGQYVEPGETLFELAEDKNLWLEAQVYPDEVKSLRPGMKATAIFPHSGKGSVNCTISFIKPSFEQGRNVTLVRAVIDNSDNRLHPGMLAILNIKTQVSKGVVIPSSALVTSNGGHEVWLRDESGFINRPVVTGIQNGDSVLVLSGLSESEMVVTSGAYLLHSEYLLQQGSSGSEEGKL